MILIVSLRLKHFKMAPFLLAKLIKIVNLLMESQIGILKMEYIKVSVSKEKKKDLEEFYTLMAHFIMETGFKT